MIADIAGFIRLRVCLSITLMTVAGYLLMNPPGMGLLFVTLSSFLSFSGAYAHNNMTDVEEDAANKRKVSRFAASRKGYAIVAACFLAGLFFSFFLPPHSMFFVGAIAGLNIFYSKFRIKKYFAVKNVYTAFDIGLGFLYGAAAAPVFGVESVAYYIIISLSILAGSIISDMRDHEGDRKAGFRTMPVVLGPGSTGKIIYLLIAMLSASVMFFQSFIILLPFLAVTAALVKMGKFSDAHSFGGASVLFLVLWLAL
jgi:4-hydroxybenzoate polyprenyltransferase